MRKEYQLDKSGDHFVRKIQLTAGTVLLHEEEF